MKRTWLIVIVLGAFIVGGLLVFLLFSGRAAGAAQVAVHYPLQFLVEEASTMSACAECHSSDKFHACSSCHDEHGSAELASVPFDDLIYLQGDVPQPTYIPVNELLPYRHQPHTQIGLLELLESRGVVDFESVTLASRDEGWITIEKENLTAEARLLPHIDGVRFASENLHISSWLKGVWRIIVVGTEKPLVLDGYHTSIGRLLLGPTVSVTIEQTDTMLRSEVDGQVRKAKTASRIEGAGILDIVGDPGFDVLEVLDGDGNSHILTVAEARGAVLAQIGQHTVLVLPARGRSQWIPGVVELITEE
ncbi:MAG: hypothetical protein P1S60_07265 [Anaerolineae bacterium]|nr:hypothetical protein [Anaerolineae bacterium]